MPPAPLAAFALTPALADLPTSSGGSAVGCTGCC